MNVDQIATLIDLIMDAYGLDATLKDDWEDIRKIDDGYLMKPIWMNCTSSCLHRLGAICH